MEEPFPGEVHLGTEVVDTVHLEEDCMVAEARHIRGQSDLGGVADRMRHTAAEEQRLGFATLYVREQRPEFGH